MANVQEVVNDQKICSRQRLVSARPRAYPLLLRGKIGIIERQLGAFENPEQRAYRQKADKLQLLRVRFTMAEIWGKNAEIPTDTLDAEIYEHWLEPIDAT